MEQIAISKWKATCLAVLEIVNKTGEPIPVTRFGKPVAMIMPPGIPHHVPRFGTGIGGDTRDIVGSIGDESDWQAAQDPESDN